MASHDDAAATLGPHDVAVVLGSGWADVVEGLGDVVATWVAADLPGFTPPSVGGHGGEVRSVRAGDRRVLVFTGRVHLYERHPASVVVHGVRTAAAAGCRTVVLTNAAGGIHPSFTVGQPVLISDHINLTGTTPLVGPAFVDMTDAYSSRLRQVARSVDRSLAEGVYAGLPGPSYETPAEIRMLEKVGADLVGMSTVLEAIAAREAGMEVLGVSLVTNVAAGITGDALDHADVLATGERAKARVAELLGGVVRQL